MKITEFFYTTIAISLCTLALSCWFVVYLGISFWWMVPGIISAAIVFGCGIGFGVNVKSVTIGKMFLIKKQNDALVFWNWNFFNKKIYYFVLPVDVSSSRIEIENKTFRKTAILFEKQDIMEILNKTPKGHTTKMVLQEDYNSHRLEKKVKIITSSLELVTMLKLQSDKLEIVDLSTYEGTY